MVGNDISRITAMFDAVNKPLSNLVANQLKSLSTPDFNDLYFKLSCCRGSIPRMYGYVARFFVKSLEWLPSLPELIIFGTFVALVFIIIEMIHNNYINERVKKESRCAKEKESTPDQVTAIDANGNTLYTVKYNADKQATLECEANNLGNSRNEYTVKLYDPTSANSAKIQNKLCAYQNFSAASGTTASTGQIYYTGDSGLVRFMETNDLAYFKR